MHEEIKSVFNAHITRHDESESVPFIS